MSRPRDADPFATLRQPAKPWLGDDEGRAAWRQTAAARVPQPVKDICQRALDGT